MENFPETLERFSFHGQGFRAFEVGVGQTALLFKDDLEPLTKPQTFTAKARRTRRKTKF